MNKKLLIVTFASLERFQAFFTPARQSRRALIPLRNPLPNDTAVVVLLLETVKQHSVILQGSVTRQLPDGCEIVFDEFFEQTPPDTGREVPTGIVPEAAAEKAPKEDQRLQWLREIVSDGERKPAPEMPPDPPLQTTIDKKTLTPQEQERAAPVGTFIMNLTKAILRTGYYDPDHPGAQTARRGLHDEFQKVLGDSRELMLTKEQSREHEDIVITGLLDSPVPVRMVVGKGVAALFVPKLYEYFEKKKLLSIAIKKQIGTDHFDAFIAVMSNPEVDRVSGKDAGRMLTNDMVKNNITEISAVFEDDQLNFEKNLPWRVAMAMHRLAKDLKLLPLFKGIPEEVVSKMKRQSVEDIIRPLVHPRLLNDFLVNCYIIAEHVKNMTPREIEQIIVDALPARTLLPASQYTFAELEWLNRKAAEEPDDARIEQRLQGIKRILKMISRRIVIEDITGGHHFLAYLYENEILRFEELPVDAQYVINTRKMATDIRKNIDDYENAVAAAKSGEDLMVYINCFRRAAPLLIENGDWQVLQRISGGINAVAAGENSGSEARIQADAPGLDHPSEELSMENGIASEENDKLERLFAYIFKDQSDKLVHAYETADPDKQLQINALIDEMGYFGIQILGRILCETKDRQLRGQISAMLTQRPDMARQWVKGVLINPKHPWFVYRNAILILGEVSNDSEDADLVRGFLEDEHPRLRLEALGAIVSLKPEDRESLIIGRIMDTDNRVNWRAVKAIAELSEISEKGMDTILSLIRSVAPEEPEASSVHFKHVARLITAIQGLPNIAMPKRVESDILDFIKGIAPTEKKWHRLLKLSRDSEDEMLAVKAAVPLLGRIGGKASESFLNGLERSWPALTEAARHAIQTIQNRETGGR